MMKINIFKNGGKSREGVFLLASGGFALVLNAWCFRVPETYNSVARFRPDLS